MDTKALKDKILQLAIQGKLVPQDENDEPVSVLLEKIKAEKERLIKDKVIKKEKQLPEISDDEKSFTLPNTWKWCRLGNICKQITDGAHKTPKYVDAGIPFLSVKNISKGYLDFSDTKYISEEEHKSLISRCNPQRNDLLFCRIGTLGRFKVIDIDTEFSIFVSLGLIKLSDNIYPKYMEYVLNSTELYSQYYEIKVDGSHTSKLNLRDIPNLKVPLPPLAEQKRIVAKVDSLFKLIDELDNNKQDLLQNIYDTRNKVLQLAIQGKLVDQNEDDEPASVLLERIKEEKERLINKKVIKKEKPLPEISEEEKLFELPKGWEWVRLGDITKIYLGLTHRPEYVDKGIPFLSVKDISGGKILFENCKYIEENKFNSMPIGSKPIKGDVLFGRVGTLGKPSIVDIDFPFGIFVSLGFLRPFIIDMNKYLKIFMESQLFFDQIHKNVSGVAQVNLNTGWLNNFVIPLPPLEEQKRIVDKVDTIMNYLDELEKQIN